MGFLDAIQDAAARAQEEKVNPSANWIERRDRQMADRIDRAAKQQGERAVRMSGKLGRGNRRAAKATMRATALHEQAAARRT